MEGKVFEILDLYWDHEPGIPGGETPPSTAGGTPAATDGRFMGQGYCQSRMTLPDSPESATSKAFRYSV
jgi:hypothetical protein